MHLNHRNALPALLLGSCVLIMPGVVSAQDANSTAQSGSSSNVGYSPAQSAGSVAGQAGKATKLGEITVTGNTVNKLAPSAAPLDAIQPTSVIDERFIRDSLRLDASYSSIIKYSPNVSVTSPEGPGLGKMEGTSIRGFQDGQFNVTFDGIPFGNQSDLHHSTSAYFTNHILGQAEIDRGPGGAATIGNATFGGTLGLRSRDPSPQTGVTPYVSLGSWNYRGVGVDANGKLGKNTGIFADVSRSSSDTYLKGTDDKAKHAFVKTVSQLGSNATLTFVTSYNEQAQNTVQGATKEQMATYGPRFGLGNDPSVQNYKGYNDASYYSSFNYLGLTTSVGNWDIDNKVYFITFAHISNKATDASDIDPSHNGVTFYDANGDKAGKVADDVPGKRSDSHYHSFGDVFRVRRYFGANVLKFGLWVERDIGGKWSKPKDLTTGEDTGYKYGSAYKYLYAETDDTVQPYVEYDWALNDWLTLAPGLRYTQTTRNLNAALNKSGKSKGKPFHAKAEYSATLPSLSLHARITDQWTAYAQYAKGFLAPPVDVIEVAGAKDLDPEMTTNFQIGTAYATSKLTYGADIYYIDFSNMLAETEVSTDLGKEDTFVNSSGAIYKGVEFEITYALSRSLSLYGNASYNDATYKHTNVQLAAAPKVTSALGLLYNNGQGLYGSVMSKFRGEMYGLDNTTDDDGNTVFANSERLGGFTTVDATIGYRSKHGGPTGKGYMIALNISNLFNVHKLAEYAGTQDVSGEPLYFAVAGRGIFLDMSMKF